MKKRLIAALVLLTLVIGLCGTIMASAQPAEYQVGYAKVDINPYYTEEARDYLLNYFTEAALQQVEAYWKKELGVDKLVYGETIMPVSLQGNSHTEYRLTIGKQDDNGDGIVDENDGIFATCIAVTDPNGETVFLIATDMINGEISITSQVRKMIYDKYGIAGDRVMIDGSHSHHAPSFRGDSNVSSETAVKKTGVPFPGDVNFRQAAYHMHQYWVAEVLPQKLFEAAQKSLDDQSAATMSKGSIDAEDAMCATENIVVGDSLNAIRQENRKADPERYGETELVTVLHGSLPAGVTVEGTNDNGEEYWFDTDGVKHVVVPKLADGLYYNGVRHDQSTVVEAVRKTVWHTSGQYYACLYPKAGEKGYEYISTEDHYYIPSNWIVENGKKVGEYTNEQIEANGIYNVPTTYVTGNNFNGGLSAIDGVGSYDTSRSIYIVKNTWDPDYRAAGNNPLPRAYIERNAVDISLVDTSSGYPKLTKATKINGRTFYKGERLYRFVDAVTASEDNDVTEVDDTLLILKFDRDEYAGKQDILLVNWRSHTNRNRKVSVDWKKEYTAVGFYDSFFQISSDWINAFRYALETQGYLVAYFSGASGNVNGYTPFGDWYEQWLVPVEENGKIVYKERRATYVAEADVGKTEALADGSGFYTYETADIGKCKESILGYSVYDKNLVGYVVRDASQLRNDGPVYATELAEVALELLNGNNINYQMKEIQPTGGLRSLQDVYQTMGKTSSTQEFLAAGKHHYQDVKEDGFDNLGSTLTFSVFWWTDKNGLEIVDKKGYCSMLNEDGTLAQKCVQGVPQADTYYTEKDVTDLYDVTFVDGVIQQEGQVAIHRDSYTIASFYHAGKALSTYRTAASGPAVELNAIMLCDQIALITANGELFDRYSDNAVWTANGIKWTTMDGEPDNKWEILWSDTYGEPFYLGYCNDGNGYMPSKITYNYSTNVPGKSQGSYETQTGNYAEGTGEKVMEEFAWMLANIDNISNSTTGMPTKEFYCEHCKDTKQWLPLNQVLETHKDAEGQYHNLPLDGHYYVDSEEPLPAFNARNICLELDGKEMKGPDRALTVGAGGEVSIQDSSEEKTGALVGRGFEGGNAHGGTLTVPRGAILNLYSGTLKLNVEDGREIPENGAVLYIAGTYNMYSGTVQGGECHNAGGTIYTDDNSDLNLYGGTIENGMDYVGKGNSIGTKCSRIRGNVLLSGNASVAELSIWPEGAVEGYYSKITVQGKYTGTTKITFRSVKSADLSVGKVIGFSENADISEATIDVTSFGADNAVGQVAMKDYKGDELSVVGSELVLGDLLVKTCQHCEEEKVWLPVSQIANNTTITDGHYHVDKDNHVITNASVGGQMCLELNGKTLKGNYRAFDILDGGTLNIQDSGENGTLVGQGFKTNQGTAEKPYGGNGGTVHVAYGGTLNLYSGTLTYQKANEYNPGNGGVVYTAGTFNMYGGTVCDGISGWVAGNIYVERNTLESNKKAFFNAYGGTVSGGVCTNIKSSYSVVVRGYATLSSDADVNRLTLFYPPEGNAPLGDMLTIEGEYTGTTQIHLYSFKGDIAEGLDIGNSNKADIENATLTVCDSEENAITLKVVVANETDDLVLEKPEVAKVAKVVTLGGEEQTFATLEEAAAQVDSPYEENNLFIIPEKLVLMANAEELTLNQNIVLDLNGYNIGKLTATDDATVYCMDGANVVEEEENNEKVVKYYAERCGVVTETKGNVVAVPAGAYKVEGGYTPTYLYLAFRDKGGRTTYHAADLDVKYQYLRPSESGMYFSAEFGGDTVVAGAVESFGIAMSTKGIPTAATMGTTALYTEMVNNEDHRFGETNLKNVQNILTNIMKPDISVSNNRIRAATKIYVRAYVKIDGEYYFGNRKTASLKSMIEKISTDYISDDGVISVLGNEQQKELLNMYEKYANVMNYWNTDNLKVAAEKAKQ